MLLFVLLVLLLWVWMGWVPWMVFVLEFGSAGRGGGSWDGVWWTGRGGLLFLLLRLMLELGGEWECGCCEVGCGVGVGFGSGPWMMTLPGCLSCQAARLPR